MTLGEGVMVVVAYTKKSNVNALLVQRTTYNVKPAEN